MGLANYHGQKGPQGIPGPPGTSQTWTSRSATLVECPYGGSALDSSILTDPAVLICNPAPPARTMYQALTEKNIITSGQWTILNLFMLPTIVGQVINGKIAYNIFPNTAPSSDMIFKMSIGTFSSPELPIPLGTTYYTYNFNYTATSVTETITLLAKNHNANKQNKIGPIFIEI